MLYNAKHIIKFRAEKRVGYCTWVDMWPPYLPSCENVLILRMRCPGMVINDYILYMLKYLK